MYRIVTEEYYNQSKAKLLWAPIAMAIGSSVYFRLSFEPSLSAVGICATLSVFLAIFGVTLRRFLLLSLVPALILAGFVLASWIAHSKSAPVLGWRFYGPIEGVVEKLDRSGSDRLRVTLVDPKLGRISPGRTPKKVRVSLHSDEGVQDPRPGEILSVLGHLSPPSGPVEPGGFDFQRHAWFLELGAVGYARKPASVKPVEGDPNFQQRISKVRYGLSDWLGAHMPAKEGGFAAAILTGDRSKIDLPSLEHLRQSNLAHLLAISGLHMGLMVGVIFFSFRTAIILIPHPLIRLYSKKIAAVIALAGGLSYLLISGAAIATERAFVMVAVMLVAILLDRPALSLRSVAIAALIILIKSPESVLNAGFQMSFAATTALIFVFQELRNRKYFFGHNATIRLFRPIISLALSSLVAGFATAPFAAFHFNQMAHYGLIANMASLPIMGFLIMPSALSLFLTAPLGLEWISFWVLEHGIAWILGVAEFVSGLEGAISKIRSGHDLSLPLIVVGALCIILLTTRLRYLGPVAIAFGLLLWQSNERPSVLVSDNGRLVGVYDQGARALNRNRGNGFIARNWLANDGSLATQDQSAELFSQKPDLFTITLSDYTIAYHWDKTPESGLLGQLCRSHDLVIYPNKEVYLPGGCKVISKQDLKQGAIAIYETETGVKIETARDITGRRLWNSRE